MSYQQLRHILEDLDHLRIKVRYHQDEAYLANIRIHHWLMRLRVFRKMILIWTITRKELKLVVNQDLQYMTMVLWGLIIECVPDEKRTLKEAHHSRSNMHPSGTKMYKYLKEIYWGNNMEKEIAKNVAECEMPKSKGRASKTNGNDSEPCGSGRKLPWILWQVCRDLLEAMILFGW